MMDQGERAGNCAARVAVRAFGQCAAGPVKSILLHDGAGMTVELLSLGATVRAITLPDCHGVPTDVCLGYDTPEEYLSHDGYLGACIGRNANRIAGASISIGGQEWPLSANEGANQLHGGREGFDRKLWAYETSEDGVTFSLHSPHLQEGFPGDLAVSVTYRLPQPGVLELTYQAECDRDTLVNLTNHAYFNLGGHGSGAIDGHTLRVAASAYTPCGAGNIPLGDISPVVDTALDLCAPVRLGDLFANPALAEQGGLDHNFVLEARENASAALLHHAGTGIAMELYTDQPGVQVYTAGGLSPRPGKQGAMYGPRHGICLETQAFPDAIHHAAFPSPILRAGEQYRQRTRYRFFVLD